MPDYIPTSDDSFLTWAENFSSQITADPTEYGLTAPDATALAALVTAFSTARAAQVAAQADAAAATANKNDARAALENAIRSEVPRILINPGYITGHLMTLGLPPRDTIPTASPVPATHPTLELMRTERLELLIGFRDSGATNKAKPAGVRGREFWVKIGGTPPTGLSECQYLGTDTKTPFLASFDEESANQTAYLIGRWINTRDETGPISETLAVTIPG